MTYKNKLELSSTIIYYIHGCTKQDALIKISNIKISKHKTIGYKTAKELYNSFTK